MSTDRPWDESVDVAPDPQLVSIAHACFDFARAGDTARLRAYVEQGVPANFTDATGNTLLMLSAHHGHPETVGALVALGADPDRTNDRGQSPLAGAIFKGEDDVVQVNDRRCQAMTQRSRPDSFEVYRATSAMPISSCGVVALLSGRPDPPMLTVTGMRWPDSVISVSTTVSGAPRRPFGGFGATSGGCP